MIDMKIKYNNEVYPYSLTEFIYQDLLKALWRNQLKDEDMLLSVNVERAKDFAGNIREVLEGLLSEFYIEPKKDDIFNHRGRYEKISFNGIEYNLNVTTNAKDRIAYQIFTFYIWILDRLPEGN